MTAQPRRSRRFLVPETIQTSAMDCGPASLKSILEGYDIPVSYGRLREACQTDVDGSSIDTMEEIARQLGLDAEQVMVPVDHLLLSASGSLPGIVVVRQPNGFTHFVLAWRAHGPLVQVMDPATGRRWTTKRGFLEDLYVHSMPVPAAAWRGYADGDLFLGGLRAIMHDLKIGRETTEELIGHAIADTGWYSLAALDASLRMIGSLAGSGGLPRRSHRERMLRHFFDESLREGPETCRMIPADYWSVRPAPPDSDGEAQLQLRGAVLVRVMGRRTVTPDTEEELPLSAELVGALEEPPSRPGRRLLDLFRTDGLLAPLVVLGALLIAAAGVVAEALLFRGLFDLGFRLVLPEQRLVAIGAIILVIASLLLLDLPIITSLLRFGRRLEVRLRLAFMEKIPRLGDRYFQSRPISDMAERSHSIHNLRLLPELGGQLIRSIFQFLLTIVGIIWLDPANAPTAVIGGAIVVAVPFLFLPILSERDLKARTHVGALGRFYLDALLGLIAVRTHGAERAVRREHESLLVEWIRAGLRVQRTATMVDALQSIFGMGLAILLLFNHVSRSEGTGGVLLLAYWALQLPMLGQTIGLLARQYPTQRNMTLRLLEPLGAPEEKGEADQGEEQINHQVDSSPVVSGVAISMRDVHVVAAGHTILSGVNLEIEAGSHIAIVGHSGAGKSSVAGLLLGWHRAAAGEIRVDGSPLDEHRLARLRREIAWIDPAVQIWNRPFIENLFYGNDGPACSPGQAVESADLRGVLERLPAGLLTPLGENGGLVSGGEGQRVRFGRALLRSGVRLVILDEPFRGLDRERRRALLDRTRTIWRDATILCITHDVAETLPFERVLVLDRGEIVEDDAPALLAAEEGSRYRALLDADEALRRGAWSGDVWRHLRIDDGKVVERARREEAP